MNDGIEVFKNFLEIHEETLKHDVFVVYQRIFDFMLQLTLEEEFMYRDNLYKKTLDAMEFCYEHND